MAAPTYIGNGGIDAVSGSTSLNIDYPGSINANDILIMQVMCANTTYVNRPSGWHYIANPRTLAYHSFYCWKRATGSESGSQTVTVGSSSSIYGVISNWRGADANANPIENPIVTEGAPSSSLTSAATTPLTDDSTVICFANIEDDTTCGDLTDYGTADFNVSSGTGTDGRNSSYTRQAPSRAVPPAPPARGAAAWSTLFRPAGPAAPDPRETNVPAPRPAHGTEAPRSTRRTGFPSSRPPAGSCRLPSAAGTRPVGPC